MVVWVWYGMGMKDMKYKWPSTIADMGGRKRIVQPSPAQLVQRTHSKRPANFQTKT